MGAGGRYAGSVGAMQQACQAVTIDTNGTVAGHVGPEALNN